MHTALAGAGLSVSELATVGLCLLAAVGLLYERWDRARDRRRAAVASAASRGAADAGEKALIGRVATLLEKLETREDETERDLQAHRRATEAWQARLETVVAGLERTQARQQDLLENQQKQIFNLARGSAHLGQEPEPLSVPAFPPHRRGRAPR